MPKPRHAKYKPGTSANRPKNRERFWTWCFRAQLYTLFRIDKSRGSQVLVEVLGTECNGVLGCDYFSRALPFLLLSDQVGELRKTF